MTDRELLERAALAFWAGEIDDVCSVEWGEQDNCILYTHGDNQDHNGADRTYRWNPLEENADCFELALKLRIWPDYRGCAESGPAHASAHYLSIRGRGSSERWIHEHYVPEEMFVSSYAADRTQAVYLVEEEGLTRGFEAAQRRAIVRAAASIGPTP